MVRWGILGTGFAAVHFADGLRAVPGARLEAVASRSLPRAQRLAARGHSARALTPYEALFEDPGIDIVYVATGNAEHEAHCLQALSAGKAVLCEKPFALDAGQAARVIDAARAHGRFCMEALRPRFLPVLRRIRQLIDSGAIGQPLSLHASLGHRFAYDSGSRFFDPAQGGGALLDLGVYPLSLALALFGEPLRIQAQATLAESGVDRDVRALLDFGAGRSAVVTASLHGALPADAWIAGDEGLLQIHGPLYSAERLSLHPGARLQHGREDVLDAPVHRTGRRALPLVPLLRRLRDRTRIRHERVPASPNGFTDEAAEATRCLQQGLRESPLLPLDDTLKLMRCLDRIRNAWAVEDSTA